jgi:hypothetical protein
MLEPPSAPPVHVNISASRIHADESFTEDYGDPEGSRGLGAGVDFFSNLGKEVKKKPLPVSNDVRSKACHIG